MLSVTGEINQITNIGYRRYRTINDDDGIFALFPREGHAVPTGGIGEGCMPKDDLTGREGVVLHFHENTAVIEPFFVVKGNHIFGP